MNISKRHSVILGFGVLLLFFVFASVLVKQNQSTRSADHAVGTSEPGSDTHPPSVNTQETSEGDAQEKDSAFALKDFHRSETRGGEVVWEVRGANAKFYPEDNSVKVDNGHLTFFNDKKEKVEIIGKQARLHLKGRAVHQANAYDGVKLIYDERVTVTSKTADYDSEKQLVTAPGDVKIESPFITVTGKGLLANVETQELLIKKQVESMILPRKKRKKETE